MRFLNFETLPPELTLGIQSLRTTAYGALSGAWAMFVHGTQTAGYVDPGPPPHFVPPTPTPGYFDLYFTGLSHTEPLTVDIQVNNANGENSQLEVSADVGAGYVVLDSFVPSDLPLTGWQSRACGVVLPVAGTLKLLFRAYPWFFADTSYWLLDDVGLLEESLMPTSTIAIINQALSEVGESEFITDVDEDTDNAKIAKIHWLQAQEDLLTAAPWGFCQKRIALALSATDPGTEWAYRYVVPSDCLRARRLEGAGRRPGADQEVPWQIEWDAGNAAPSLLTDLPNAVLVYTMSGIPVPFYPVWFANALIWKLAAALSMARTKDAKMQSDLAQKAEFYKSQAFAADLNQRGQDPQPESEFIRARGGSSWPADTLARW